MITTEFDKFCFHDAFVEKIARRTGVVSISFKGAFMNKEHPDSNGKDWVIDCGVLHLYNVSEEVSLFWYDNIAGKPHPQPEFPLDEITNLDFDGNIFDFGGFLKHEPWVEWKVYATEFRVDIEERHVASIS